MSNGRLLHGQEYLPKDGFTVPFTQRMMDNESADALVGQAKTDINPVDMNASLVRVYGEPESLSTYYLAVPDTESFVLPDLLEAVNITYNKSQGDGAKESGPGASHSEGVSGGLDFHPSAQAQASASIVPELDIRIKQYWAQNVPVIRYTFYMQGNVTVSQLLAKMKRVKTITLTNAGTGYTEATVTITGGGGSGATATAEVGGIGELNGITVDDPGFGYSGTPTVTITGDGTGATAEVTEFDQVLPWPAWKPEAHTITLKSQEMSVQVSAEAYHRDNWALGSGNLSWSRYVGEGYSKQGSATTKTVRIPPTIHGEITIAGEVVVDPPPSGVATILSDQIGDAFVNTNVNWAYALVEASAKVPVITAGGGAPSFVALESTPDPITFYAVASVTPTSLSATSPSGIPTSGLYLLKTNSAPWRDEWSIFQAIVVDFAHFA